MGKKKTLMLILESISRANDLISQIDSSQETSNLVDLSSLRPVEVRFIREIVRGKLRFPTDYPPWFLLLEQDHVVPPSLPPKITGSTTSK